MDRMDRLVEHFLILRTEEPEGPEDPEQPHPPEQSLRVVEDSHYPPHLHDELPGQLESLAFPQAPRSRGLKESPLPVFHSFVLTDERGTTLYGAALVVYEHCPSRRKNRLLPKALLLLSRWPFLAAYKRYLRQLYLLTAVHAAASLERCVVNLLGEVPLPPRGRTRVQMGLGALELTLERPPADELPTHIADMSLLFGLLDGASIVRVWAHLLLEHRVVVHSADVEALTPVCEALRALLFPLAWQHAYVPLMPRALAENMDAFLEAPVPFLVGVASEHVPAAGALPAELVVVDLNKSKVSVTGGLDADPLPDKTRRRLARFLGVAVGAAFSPDAAYRGLFRWRTELHASAAADELQPEPEPEPEQDRDRQYAVQKKFLATMVACLGSYRDFFLAAAPVEGPLSQRFDFDGFVRHRSESQRRFVGGLVHTQAFHMFLRDALEPSAREFEALFFDNAIAAAGRPDDTPSKFDSFKTVVAPMPSPSGSPPQPSSGVRPYPVVPSLDPERCPRPRTPVRLVDEAAVFSDLRRLSANTRVMLGTPPTSSGQRDKTTPTSWISKFLSRSTRANAGSPGDIARARDNTDADDDALFAKECALLEQMERDGDADGAIALLEERCTVEDLMQVDENNWTLFSLVVRMLFRHGQASRALQLIEAVHSGRKARARLVERERVVFEEDALGVTLEVAENSYGCRVYGFTRSGPAERCGRVRVGDLVESINGQFVLREPFADVMDMLRTAKRPLALGVARSSVPLRLADVERHCLEQDPREPLDPAGILPPLGYALSVRAECDRCPRSLAPGHIRAGWSEQSSDYATRCPDCAQPLPCWLSVEGAVRDAPFVSPAVLRKEVENVLVTAVSPQLDMPALRRDHATIYWNLVVTLLQLKCPLDFVCLGPSSPAAQAAAQAATQVCRRLFPAPRPPTEALAGLRDALRELRAAVPPPTESIIPPELGPALARLAQQAANERARRRAMQQQLLDATGRVRVFCRVRPLLASDGPGAREAVEAASDTAVAVDERQFDFDAVLGPDASQDAVFEELRPVVEAVLEGHNACVLAYGQTGSGKTHTMGGVCERAFGAVFALLAQAAEPQAEFSQLEIYNEAVVDLLAGSGASLSMRLQQDGAAAVQGLSWHAASAAADVVALARAGDRRRQTADNNMNARSSRSHAVQQLRVSSSAGGVRRTGTLVLVDLAGSERLARTAGARVAEAKAINKSLSALGNVVSALGAGARHVPYRDSKLTFLLQHCLGGNSKTVVLVHASPTAASVPETLCTLMFGERVGKVKNKARRQRQQQVSAARERERGDLAARAARLDGELAAARADLDASVQVAQRTQDALGEANARAAAAEDEVLKLRAALAKARCSAAPVVAAPAPAPVAAPAADDKRWRSEARRRQHAETKAADLAKRLQVEKRRALELEAALKQQVARSRRLERRQQQKQQQRLHRAGAGGGGGGGGGARRRAATAVDEQLHRRTPTPTLPAGGRVRSATADEAGLEMLPPPPPPPVIVGALEPPSENAAPVGAVKGAASRRRRRRSSGALSDVSLN